ncbi:DUF1707 domain-containing protein [Actinomadura sp. ATCC 31491]|uniref:DUF1707 domain-containing protein n=1 Tax=Actinomadura luzonensis TaxID=2805427 RepID=A0ABT0FJL2_9ACTN|nr:DUF1707 domain-containing protein [Actinomadura luzonensis]MCK2212482.1 DUF1707 domain-containing protein [Actinomadura luzonensis]
MSDLHMLVSDEDRERTTKQLQQAFAEGRLTRPELEERIGLALTARTYGDLLGLITDLPAAQAVPAPEDVVELETKNDHVKRSGDWAVPRRLRVVSKYGGVDLDLSEAVIPHPVVEIDLELAYGSAKIVLPEGGTANVDGVRSDWGRVSTGDVPGRPRAGAVHVVITGTAKYGGVSVRYPRKRWFTH